MSSEILPHISGTHVNSQAGRAGACNCRFTLKCPSMHWVCHYSGWTMSEDLASSRTGSAPSHKPPAKWHGRQLVQTWTPGHCAKASVGQSVRPAFATRTIPTPVYIVTKDSLNAVCLHTCSQASWPDPPRDKQTGARRHCNAHNGLYQQLKRRCPGMRHTCPKSLGQGAHHMAHPGRDNSPIPDLRLELRRVPLFKHHESARREERLRAR